MTWEQSFLHFRDSGRENNNNKKTFFVFPLLSLFSGLREERYHFSLSLSASNLEKIYVAFLLRRKTFIYHDLRFRNFVSIC